MNEMKAPKPTATKADKSLHGFTLTEVIVAAGIIIDLRGDEECD
jgi:type II secretory pathway pseudopilin PulG